MSYYQKNKEKMIEYARNYKIANKDKIKVTNRDYKDDNREKIDEYQNRKFTCACGGSYSYKHKAVHCRTAKHLNFIQSLPIDYLETEI